MIAGSAPTSTWPWSWVTRIPPRAWDVAVVVALAAAGVASLAARWPEDAPHQFVAVAVLVLQVGPFIWRRRWPMGVLIFTAVAIVAKNPLGVHFGGPDLGLLVAVYGAAAWGGRYRWLAMVGAVALTALLALNGLITDGWLSAFRGAEVGIVLCGAYLIGDNLRVRRANLAELEGRLEHEQRDRERELVRGVEEERSRIARELHDLVTHHVSAIAVQAESMRARHPDGEAGEAFARIASSARLGLSELRQLLGVLRRAGDQRAPRSPQPGLDDVDALIAQARASGLDVRVTVTGRRRSLASAVELSAYRIVQESLTNAVKHAPGARVDVLFDYRPSDVVIQVVDNGSGSVHPSPLPSAGSGLAGMRERVGLVGGQFDAGPIPGGGFRVEAQLPAQAQA